MQNAGLDNSQAEIKIAGRNINNLRYGNDITLMAESEEELKSLFFKIFLLLLFFLLYNIVLVLPYINMHPSRVYTCSPS